MATPLSLALAQFRPRKGAYDENLRRLGARFRELAEWSAPPALVVAPEAALTGYFLEGGVRDLAVSAERLYGDLERQHRDSGAPPFDITIGFYEIFDNRLFNAALYAELGGGGIRHVHRKVFLPTYGVFDEERFVEGGRTVQAFDTRWGRAAMLVCEDVWHSFTPMLAALDGAQLILIPSASPARGVHGVPRSPSGDGSRPESLDRWERIVQAIAGEHGVYVALAQLVGFEGGKAFLGGSLVGAPRGDIVARGPLFDDALVPVRLDLEEILRARAELPLLADLEMRLPHLLGSLHHARRRGGRSGGGTARPAGADGSDGSLGVDARAQDAAPKPATSSQPVLPPALPPDPLAIDAELVRRWLVEFIRDEVQRRRGFENVVIGLSGGVDSSLVAYLAVEALGREHVLGVRMPYRTSSPESLEHAQLVIDALGIPSRTVDVSAAVDGLAGAIQASAAAGSAAGTPIATAGPPDPSRLGNIMARTRMITLFDLSAAVRGLPLGTGNKTERLFGYFTWHADDSPPVNPIGDLFKTQVWALARHLGVPDVIVAKPASADLVRGQTDEGDFGITYPRADLILHCLLLGYHAPAIAALGFTEDDIALVRRRLDSTHWKRRLPTVAMLSSTAIGEYYLRPVDY